MIKYVEWSSPGGRFRIQLAQTSCEMVQVRALEVFAGPDVARDLCTTAATVERPPGVLLSVLPDEYGLLNCVYVFWVALFASCAPTTSNTWNKPASAKPCM